MIKNIKMGFGLLLVGVIMLAGGSITHAQTVIDLTARVSQSTTPGVVLRWYRDAARSTPLANPKGVVPTSTPTNYWVFFYDESNDCFSPGTKITVVDAPCPIKTVDLTALSGGNVAMLVWHSSPVPSTSTEVGDPTNVGAGTYWAFFYDAESDCYSPPGSSIIVGGDCSLPVTLVNFEAYREGRTTRLEWTTSSEENSKGFEIQRGADAKSWQSIGFVDVKSVNGTSRSLLQYNFLDKSLLNGANYYRLKMIDLDGTFDYSPIRTILNVEEDLTMYTYPNPVQNGKFTIYVADTDSYYAEVINATGVAVLNRNIGRSREINVEGMVAGVYILRIVSINGTVKTRTFVVK